MKDFLKNFSARLKEIRGPLSMSEFARKIGVSVKTYQNYEYGTRKPSLKFIIQTSYSLKVDSNWLLGISDIPHSVPSVAPSEPRDAEVARLWALVESQQRTIEALAKGGAAPAAPAASSGSSRGSARALDA